MSKLVGFESSEDSYISCILFMVLKINALIKLM